LKEFGDKLPADKKGPIEAALSNLKEAHKNQDLDKIDQYTKELNEVFHKASEEMYKASAQGGAQGSPGDNGQPQGGNAGSSSGRKMKKLPM
jgi:molecular chaperone DnaK